jgi:hypothetical protein
MNSNNKYANVSPSLLVKVGSGAAAIIIIRVKRVT